MRARQPREIAAPVAPPQRFARAEERKGIKVFVDALHKLDHAALSRSQVRLRFIAMIGCIPWGLFGLVHGSIPQVAFSTIYFFAMGISIIRIMRGNWQPRQAPDDVAMMRADGP